MLNKILNYQLNEGSKFSNQEEDHFYYLAFSYFLKIGPKKMNYLENYFPSLNSAFTANATDLTQAGLSPALSQEFINWRKTFSLEAALKELAKENISFITRRDPKYPKLLLEIYDPPYILYYQGQIETINNNYLAIVGTRRPSAYAEKIINRLMPELITANIIIISGLATGVDSLAHQAALHEQGLTIGILGSGLAAKNIYPASNHSLAKKIIETGGALISEFPPSMPPLKQNFPRRNRLISGMSQAVLIIEAQKKSGSLITAQHALEQNREVLAIPGNIFSEFSVGPNNLIKLGAKAITEINDILEIYNLTPSLRNEPQSIKHQINFQPENEAEKLVYQSILDAHSRGEKISTDKIIKNTKLDTATINSTLSILEIKGIAKNEETGYDLK